MLIEKPYAVCSENENGGQNGCPLPYDHGNVYAANGILVSLGYVNG